MEAITIEQLTEREESAVNSGAATSAALQMRLQTYVRPRLRALEVLFQGYPGEWSYEFRGHFTLTWDGASLYTYRDSAVASGKLPADADPEVQVILAVRLVEISEAFTKHLNLLLTAGDDK